MSKQPVQNIEETKGDKAISVRVSRDVWDWITSKAIEDKSLSRSQVVRKLLQQAMTQGNVTA